MKLTPLLQALRLPKRLTSEEAAELLGFPVHAIPVLVQAGLMVPLGRPQRNSVKHFCSDDLLTVDRAWLDRAERVLAKHWQQKRLNRVAEIT
ncbi:MAG TPA: hypothetical protein VGF13_19395 [Verrucomicrobiae bacterium]|jgi:hypothetical protein